MQPFSALRLPGTAEDVDRDGRDDVTIGIPTPDGAGILLAFRGLS